MATGKARPDKPEQTLIDEYITPGFGRPSDIARREVTEPEAKSKAELDALADVQPTGEEVHQKARELSPDSVEGKANLELAKLGVQPKKVTGEEIIREVAEDKKARLAKTDDQAKAVRDQEEKVKKAKETEEQERKKATEQMDKEAKQKAESAKDLPKDVAKK